MQINPDTITDIEFGVCLFPESGATFHRVPIAPEVKESLLSIFSMTTNKLHEKGQEPRPYESSQKYGTTEHLRVGLHDSIASNLKAIYKLSETILPDPRALHNPDVLWFYFAIFRHQNGRKLIAVKRAAQFKAVVAARKRLLQVGPEALQPVSENVFRLDHEFDFIIDSQGVTILYPAGFDQIADTESFIRREAMESVKQVSKRLPFIDFSTIVDYVERSIRGAKLIASIAMRRDLHEIRRDLLCSACERNDINLVERNGKIAPDFGQEMKFLEYLDGRRYTFDAVAGSTDRYLARNRQRVERRRSK